MEQRFRLEALLERNGWHVIINAPLKTGILTRLNEMQPEALVVDLESATDHDMEVFRFLLPRCTVPVLIADDEVRQALGGDAAFGERLNDKLDAIIQRRFVPEAFELTRPVPVTTAPPAIPPPAPAAAPGSQEAISGSAPAAADAAGRSNVIETPYFSVATTARIEPRTVSADAGGDTPRTAAERAGHVWVLGASLGGPGAVARFLGGIPPDLDVAFLLVQRIGPQHVPMLVRQLNNACALDVIEAAEGRPLCSGQVVVVPVDRRIAFSAEGSLRLCEDAPAGVSVLDHAMQVVARRYRARAGAIIFSGMGDDGIKGCHAVTEHGGTVWTQDPDSCVIASMPRHVRHACKVEISADPEALAANLVDKLSTKDFARAGGAGR